MYPQDSPTMWKAKDVLKHSLVTGQLVFVLMHTMDILGITSILFHGTRLKRSTFLDG